MALSAISSTAIAQAERFSFQPQGQQQASGPDRDPNRDPDRDELDEMQKVYDRCTQRFHSQYLDCRCIAVKFLDQRMKKGAEPSRRMLLNDVYDKCPATASVAGKTYKRCLGWASMTRDNPESFCECYANHYARGFSQNPSLRPRVQQNMMSNAMAECGYNEPMNRQARQSDSLRGRDRQQSEIDALFGQGGE